ncbi:MAG: hypothetical protein WCP30_19205 [Mycobacteriaceae bacterium]
MGNHHGDQPASRRPLLLTAALIAVGAALVALMVVIIGIECHIGHR